MAFAEFTLGDGKPNLEAVLQQCLLLHCVGTDQHALADKIARTLDAEVVEWHFQPEGWPPSWAILVDEPGTALVVVSGSQNKSQILAHLGGAIPVFPIPGLAQVNQFWLEQLIRLADKVDKALTGSFNQLNWSGHSYGGAMVAMVAYPGTTQWEGMTAGQYMTVGSPRAWFSTIPPGRRGPVVRVVGNGDDQVSHLPPGGFSLAPGASFVAKKLAGLAVRWRHVGTPVYLSPDGGVSFGADNEDTDSLYEFLKLSATDWSNHRSQEYLKRCIRHYRGANDV